MVSEKNKYSIWVARLSFSFLGWFTIIMSHYLQIADSGSISISSGVKVLSSYRYFTMQTNLFVLIWWSLALIYFNNSTVMTRLHGPVKGAITIYISVTFIVFATVLSPIYHPTGFDAFSNIVLHYLVPVFFILDWFVTERVDYQLKSLPVWLLYPILYLGFSQVHGVLTTSYLYPFLNSKDLGLVRFFVSISILLVLFIVLCVICLGIAKIVKIEDKTF